MRNFNIKATEYFEAVARLGSVTKAANELGISPSAVSQQISILESQIGIKLFRRTKRRLILTLDGDRLYQTITQAFGAIRNAHSAITRRRSTRNLTLRVSPSFGTRWLGPRIGDFLSKSEEWNIRVDATPEFTSFETEAVDLDIRYGLGGWSGLSVTPIMNDLILPLCSPNYKAELQNISTDPIEQIKNARLIDSAKTLFRWDLWLALNKIDLKEINYLSQFDRSSMSIELAKQGGGIALDSVTLCLPQLQSGELVVLSNTLSVIDFPAYWFVCPARHYNRRIVKLFSEWLQKNSNEHELEARKLLTSYGCTFRPETGPDLISDKVEY